MLIIKVIQTFTSDNAYEPWKKAILAVPLQWISKLSKP